MAHKWHENGAMRIEKRRRDFLKLTGMLGAAALLPSRKAAGAEASAAATAAVAGAKDTGACALIPSALSVSYASTQTATSLPVPKSNTWGRPSSASARIYAPRRRPSAAEYLVLLSVGTACRKAAPSRLRSIPSR